MAYRTRPTINAPKTSQPRHPVTQQYLPAPARPSEVTIGDFAFMDCLAEAAALLADGANEHGESLSADERQLIIDALIAAGDEDAWMSARHTHITPLSTLGIAVYMYTRYEPCYLYDGTSDRVDVFPTRDEILGGLRGALKTI